MNEEQINWLKSNLGIRFIPEGWCAGLTVEIFIGDDVIAKDWIHPNELRDAAGVDTSDYLNS